MGKIAVLPGDGIGPEVMQQAIKVLNKVSEKYKKTFEYTFADVGGIAIDNHGTPLPDDTVKTCENADAILFGSVGGPKWENLPPEQQPERGALLPLRAHFKLFCNIRPIKIFNPLKSASSLKEEYIPNGLDIVFFRELTGGIYFGQPKEISADRTVGKDTMIYSKPEIDRISRLAFDAARLRSKKVTSVDKANVLMNSIVWRETITELHKEYSDVELGHMYVDNAAMQLVRNPSQFDVIVTGNMFGDILSDAAAMLTGSLGMLPSASINESKFGLYEPIGGTAPDIAGQNIANPIAQVLSAALMLRYTFGMDEAACDIENAIEAILEEGYRTGDIYNKGSDQKLVKTDEMGDLISAKI
ncbi:3-isopropylmalate dehydrogenase [Denitrovibrio acetiphilus DSM 12809]|uniref:3-isopropylmalate dehydrogenase n=1 Tax=Denitrovibrio acetiphilus (strain DSM 12809 / NBRC 114555 / N2460) TaxID=522772 RepID=D4H8C6_DENA2|nr:3-isopropylmalate dehydrogenase [Denitrovibrio acetiphilus]ADD68275.1 3-isopropylmalate dehydrogenase [Denitrovibrio acetiphilus DSM 12809]